MARTRVALVVTGLLAGSITALATTSGDAAAAYTPIGPVKLFTKYLAPNAVTTAVVIGGTTTVPTDATDVQLTVAATATKAAGTLRAGPDTDATTANVLSWTTGQVVSASVQLGVGGGNKDTFTNVSAGAVTLTVTITGYSINGAVDRLFGRNTSLAVTGTFASAPCTLASVWLTAGTLAGTNTVPAAGQRLAISQNAALFSLLGTTYGGDGLTNFALPDLHAAAPNGLTYVICVSGAFP
jgi:hypothetical protein